MYNVTDDNEKKDHIDLDSYHSQAETHEYVDQLNKIADTTADSVKEQSVTTLEVSSVLMESNRSLEEITKIFNTPDLLKK